MAMQSAIQAERLNSTEILPLYSHIINNQNCDTVNARDLHTFLEVGRDFSNWMKARINQYKFVEDEDFILISLNDQNGFSPKRAKTLNTGGRPTKDYFITLDMAKELAMVELH
ncbi:MULTISPECIES: antA/AntB antirepressor family protein [unclassified Marinomonas]|uniref:antA/AntB antirepressor family protein n=1 Tax=unclassified Marinomonas TaxID=196814 RepID=UPI0007AF6A5B|nr:MULTISPECIES: antA/AntB antirepressor family protein [unclassified Marinomonas]